MKHVVSMSRLVNRVSMAIFCGIASGACAHPGLRTNTGDVQPMRHVEEDGTIHVPAFDLPESAFLSEETRTALKQMRDSTKGATAKSKACPSIDDADRADMPAIRQCQTEAFYQSAEYKDLRDRYAVTMTPQQIGGVYTEVFTPRDGIARKNEKRVLINLHGGAMQVGSRTISHLESIPIASVGKIKVISIDYRQGPEYTFPAASEDVAAVYRELIKTYKPKNIGLYGCSAGGQLTAQAITWFQQENLSLPGAIGMFCSGAARVLDGNKTTWVRSDAAHIVRALSGANFERFDQLSYYKGVDRKNPLASPGNYDEVMAKFPPSLLISGTRDASLSGVVVTHTQLVRLGVKADLHVWEGMGHAFYFNPAFPESREAYDVIVKFFDAHLGT